MTLRCVLPLPHLLHIYTRASSTEHFHQTCKRVLPFLSIVYYEVIMYQLAFAICSMYVRVARTFYRDRDRARHRRTNYSTYMSKVPPARHIGIVLKASVLTRSTRPAGKAVPDEIFQ
ncbi:hypothetical protein PENSPDRAFT_364479 [Peniophora sp. CONT]|nr:hypothetical protein PENSPDRAFT_364479 [Peniophora sp. CONT]